MYDFWFRPSKSIWISDFSVTKSCCVSDGMNCRIVLPCYDDAINPFDAGHCFAIVKPGTRSVSFPADGCCGSFWEEPGAIKCSLFKAENRSDYRFACFTPWLEIKFLNSAVPIHSTSFPSNPLPTLGDVLFLIWCIEPRPNVTSLSVSVEYRNHLSVDQF